MGQSVVVLRYVNNIHQTYCVWKSGVLRYVSFRHIHENDGTLRLLTNLGLFRPMMGGSGCDSKFFRRRCNRCHHHRHCTLPPKQMYLVESGFFTTGPQKRDLGAIHPGQLSW